jgi:hypothetical protein
VAGVLTDTRARIRLVLADLPANAVTANLAAAAPIGPRAAVAARLQELLPGLTFDEKGRGTFARASYTIRITLNGDETDLIDVELDRPDAFTALKRIADRTNWRVVDPDALAFVDLDASRAAGVPVPASRRDDAPAPPERPGAAAYAKRAALAAVAVAVLWGSWQYVRSRPDTMTPMAIARTQRISDEAVRWAAERARRRLLLMKALAPRFRTNPIVLQLFDAWVASVDYRVGFGMGRFAKVDRLSDEGLWMRFQVPAPLPRSFAEAERDGYLFEFIGEHCGPMPDNMSAPDDDCDAFIYAARPLDDGSRKDLPLAFALFSEDGRIHYREHGEMPTLEDPTVDNVEGAAALPAESAGVLAGISRTIGALFERLLGPSKPSAATIAAAEGSAIQDLRALAQAEQAFSTMLNGEKYAPPEILANTKTLGGGGMPPLLPAYFTQPIRMGYRFEFAGEHLTVSPETFSWITEVYGGFSYVARPVEPGPEGRRSFVVYPDGLIYATSDDRSPTREDTPLGTDGR